MKTKNTVVIVESPAKCKTIEQYLGPGYKVMASYGHVRRIAGLDDIDIANQFRTTYTVVEEEIKVRQIERIRAEIAHSDSVIIATDDDREGEAIGWHLCELFSLPIDSTRRLLFHEITESAIKHALLHPVRLNMDLVHAQQSRQILDMLVGYNITPVLWNCISKQSHDGLSAGRCQTPALRLVYENCQSVKASRPEMTYTLIGYFSSKHLQFELNKHFASEDEVQAFLTAAVDYSFVYTCSPPKKTIKQAPEPLTTSSLQQLASNELHLSPKQTMKLAQELYENGLITYMRTDSKKYSQQFINAAAQYITDKFGEKYVGLHERTSLDLDTESAAKSDPMLDKKSKAKSKAKSGESKDKELAHEAIRPVALHDTLVFSDDISPKAIKLYELIKTRTLESCMASATFSSITAKTSAPFDYEFVYKAEQPIFLGWKILSTFNNDDSYSFLQTLKQNSVLNFKQLVAKFSLTGTKPHLSEAGLVKLLEDKGIGRPSTFASLVDKIQERKYVVKQNIEGTSMECTEFRLDKDTDVIERSIVSKTFGNETNKLVITPLGIIVIELLLDKFESFFNYGYTEAMETTLDTIAKGEYEWHQLCATCYQELLDALDRNKDIAKFNLKIDDHHSLIIGKYGPVIKCTTGSDNVSFLKAKPNLDLHALKQLPSICLEDVLAPDALKDNAIGKYKGLDLFVKKGPYGVYAQWGNEKKSLNELLGAKNDLKHVDYGQVLRFLEKDGILDPSKPVNFVRELNEHLSIRKSKHGDYIFYKKPRMKKPEFYKLSGFDGDYTKCDKTLLLNWIKLTYKVE